MRARRLITTITSSVVIALAGIAPAHAAVIVAMPANSTLPYFLTPASVTVTGGPLEFVNVDVETHNVIAVGATRPDGSAPWCYPTGGFGKGKCPLFWSAPISANATAVLGLDRATPGAQYTFECQIHPGMRGTLVIAP